MKPLPSLMLLVLLLVPWAWGLVAGRQGSGAMLRSRCDAAGAVRGACGSPREHQKVKPGSESPWILAYVPIRSCHRVLKGKYGEFSPPAYRADSPLNFWCNWTIWGGTRQHIIIYIQGFVSEEGCNRNEDKILFEGISSLVENSVVYACWKKEMHAFASFAQAVHVVLLKRHLPNRRDVQFKGKYYIFQDQEGESSSKDDVISESPPPKLPKEDNVFQSGWAENLGDALGSRTTRSTVSLGKTTVLSGELMPGRGNMPDATAVGSPRCCKEAQGRGAPEGIVPTAAQDTWRQSLSVSGDITMGFGYTHRHSSVLLETPLLGALQVKEPFLQPAGVGLESRQSALHPTLGPKDVQDLQFTIKPTCTSCMGLAALSQSLSPGRRESKESTDITTYRGVSAVSFEKAESHPQLSVPTGGAASSDADGLAKGLMPSLSSPYEVVNREHSHLLPERSQGCQSSLRGLSMTQSVLGTTGLQQAECVDISPLESFRGILRGETALHPTWDILQEHPHLHGQSSHILKTSPTDPGSLLQNAQAHVGPAAEKAHVSSFAVQSCQHQSDRAAQPGLVVPPLPSGLEHSTTAMSTLGTEATPALVVSCTAPVLADFGSTDLIPEVPLAPEPVSKVLFSPPIALHSDPASLRQRVGISLASPGEQEMLSPSPPHHPPVASALGTDKSTRHLSPEMPKLVRGEMGDQRAETSASMALMDRGPSPASITVPRPEVGLPQPEDHVSSGYGVAPASLPGAWEARRVENVVPVHHQGTAGNDKLASASIPGGDKVQKTIEAPQGHAEEGRNASSSTTPAHPAPPVALRGETLSRGQKPQEPSDSSGNSRMPGGQQQKHAELGPPWTMEYFPIRSCHLVFQNRSGMFYLPLHADITTNIWCNWTIWAGPQKHIVIYIQGLHGSDGCGKNQDRIIFQGISSSVETKVVYACQNRGTLVFATQAVTVHVLFLSGNGSLRHEYRSFKGQYYVFRDSETMGSSNDTIATREPIQETSKKEGWKTAVTKGLLPMLRASASPSATPVGGRTQPELVSTDEETQHSPDLMEDAQYGANLSEYDQLWDETKLQRSLEDSGTEGRETEADMLMGQGAGCKAEPSASEAAKGDIESMSALVTTGAPSSEVPSSSEGLLAKSSSLDQASSSLSDGVAAAACLTQTPVLEEPLLNTSTKPPLYPSPGVNAGDTVSLGESMEELFDLASALASLENSTALQSQHHPGDVLFEVTVEIKPKDWISHGGSELQKGLLESMKNHIQENLKLPASRVNELKLKEIKRMSDANLLLTFWLHLKLEERNISLLLHSQLEELLGSSAGAEKMHLVSLFVEDVNECSAGVGLCGEEAECFNGVGTYLCRCKKGYEDHSPTKSGTLCIPAAQSGISFFLRHGDILVGAAITAALSMLVAAGVLCRAAMRGRHPRRSLSPEEPPARAAEEPVMELHDLGQCLRLDPFQLKLRARPPEWLWAARVHPAQEYRVFLEQSPQL